MEGNKILGIVLIAIGALLLLGWLKIPFLVLILGILLLVVGIMILMGKLAGASWLAWVCIVLGIIMILADQGLDLDIFKDIANLIVTIGAVILIVIGVMKLL